MEEIIKTAGIAISSILALVVLIVIVRSQWTIWRKEKRQEEQHIFIFRKQEKNRKYFTCPKQGLSGLRDKCHLSRG